MTLQGMKKLENLVSAKGNAYHYIASQDRHIIDILNWIEILNNLISAIEKSDMDYELENELKVIIKRLEHEVGHRMCMIFP